MIIDEVKDLLELTEDELNDKLLEEKYNKQNLRELVRRTLKQAAEWKALYGFEKMQHQKLQKDVRETVGKLRG